MSRPRSVTTINRRLLLRRAAQASVLGTAAIGPWGTLVRALASQPPEGEGWALQSAEPVPRLVLVFLDGGWNSNFATDPVYGERLTSGRFEGVFASHQLRTPTRKPNLVTGLGFQNALAAFDSVPTAFVNGLDVEIAAHDAAANYLLTGRAAIGRNLVEPALPAMIATSRGGLASHVVLGGAIPLGETIEKAPPLVSSGGALGDLLTPPGDQFKEETREAIERTLAANDLLLFESLGDKARASLEPFRTSQKDVASAFKNFAGKLQLTEELRTRYDTRTNGNLAHFAAAWLALRHDLTTIVTIRFGGFDTHTNELNSQLPLQQQVARALNIFVADLRATQDPRDGARSLAETTTIVVTSEFTRTPRFNDTAGTDHQNTASAILLGRGVKDNARVGGTDGEAEALGWDGVRTVPKTPDTLIDGSTLVATLLDQFGLKAEAAAVSPRRIHGLFA